MSTLVNKVTLSAIKSTTDFDRTATYGLIIVVLVLVFLLYGELARAQNGEARKIWSQSAYSVLIPIIAVCSYIIAIRFLHFLAFL